VVINENIPAMSKPATNPLTLNALKSLSYPEIAAKKPCVEGNITEI
jgi:hypothetical protein